MKSLYKKLAILLLALSLVAPFLLFDCDNASATTFLVESYLDTVISDEQGGAFIVINDFDAHKHFLQHLDSSGNFTWESSGINIPYRAYQIINDGQGGVIYVWEDIINSIQGLYMQRIDNAGHSLWEDGVLIHKREGGKWPGWLSFSDIISDRDGGAIVIWQRLEDPHPIYAQKIDSVGRVVWDLKGIMIAQNTYQYNVHCVSDGMGGVITLWLDMGMKTFAQRLNKEGNLLWNTNEIPIDGRNFSNNIISDGEHGIIIVADDYHNISFIHVDSSGEVFWDHDNKNQIHPKGFIYDFKLLDNGHDGMYIVWSEGYSGINFLRHDNNLYAQQIDNSGNLVWKEGPISICIANGDQRDFELVADNTEGFIVAWKDFRNGSPYIFAQRVDAAGNILWRKNGVNLGRFYNPPRDFQMVPNGLGGVIILRDEGESLQPRTYSQIVDNKGISKEPLTSLFPPGLPRDKTDYEALIGSTIIFGSANQRPLWHWLLPAGIIVVIISVLVTFFVLRRKSRIKSKIH
jgi:hypothetical protein